MSSFPYRTVSGEVSYKRGDVGERGREWFILHAHPNGRRVVRATCEMDDEKLVRDTSWTVDEKWHPIEGHVRCVIDGQLAGSTWYKFDGNVVTCEAQTAQHGRVSQQRTSDRPYEFLGLHPLIGDGLIAAVRGRDRPGEERVINSITCSYSPNGEKDLLALPIEIGLTYLGPEKLTVPAGTFDAQRFGIRWRQEWPPADYWVFGEDYIFLKSTWSVSTLVCETTSLRMK